MKTRFLSVALCCLPTVALAELMPQDEYLAELYEYSCMACHDSASTSGAPAAGDKEAWETRLEKGSDQLLMNTIDGFGAMPPLGSCGDCTIEDLEALIAFMSGSAEGAQE